MLTGRAFRWLLPLALASLLAGCVGDLGPSNFELEPEEPGWNVGEEAAFTLRIASTVTVRAPAYTIDPEIALEEVRLNEKGVGFGGDVSTRTPSDLNFRLVQNGTPVDVYELTGDDPEVGLQLKLPEELKDSTYVLELKLFEIGWVKSGEFRVNRP